ncbi:hypothetical protein [Tunicatimonas pelagia]|uniref:hypothetical protein n=1 Tax=Tunicatimonas pelagia TaxID=931531 RepID=UPI0026666513|nr:hypothetical protein [Tunicatimonas pelagia]WKN42969.1 hypothetical protein P0M28_28425 [Tunicatimonas pelagia]
MKVVKILLTGMGFLLALSTQAHVGSPGVVFEGKAGPYSLLVSIDPPEVIPGTAQVQIIVDNGIIDHIWVKPIYWYAGDEGSPSPDEALPSEENSLQYEGMVWLMSSGTASLEITVEGAQGKGVVVVPVMAASTAQKEMEPLLGWVLAGLGILLVVLMVTIIGASVSDGTLSPDQPFTPRHRRQRWVGAGIALLVLSLVLYGGNSWWQNWADRYQRYMYRPFQATSTILETEEGKVLNFAIDTTYLSYRGEGSRTSYFIPDHGKLMHMFLIREGSLDAFAHLHPQRVDTLNYQVKLPPLPQGRYFVYADVVRWNGFAETIADTVDIPETPLPARLASVTEADLYVDPDDTYIISNPVGNQKPQLQANQIVVCGKPGIDTPLPDGSTAIWEHEANEPLVVGKLYPMTFAIQDPEGNPAQLEPYMGMMGHMVVFKNDGSVYVHLHPVGNYSMASQSVLESRIAEDQTLPTLPDPVQFTDSINQLVASIRAMSDPEREGFLMEDMGHDTDDESGAHVGHSVVTFPYVFPEAGDYRIWIQMKRVGQVLNSAFDVTVSE